MASEGNKYPHMGHLGCCRAGTTGSMEWGDSLADVAHTPLAASKIFDFILSSLSLFLSFSSVSFWGFLFSRLLSQFYCVTLDSDTQVGPRAGRPSSTPSWRLRSNPFGKCSGYISRHYIWFFFSHRLLAKTLASSKLVDCLLIQRFFSFFFFATHRTEFKWLTIDLFVK